MPEKKEKKKEDSKDEGSELEKEIEETESQEANEVLEKTSEETIDDNEFREFIQPSTQEFINIPAPVLQKVETPQQESLEQDVASSPITQTRDEEQIKYSTTSNEPNYSAGQEIKYQTSIEPTILKPAEISENLPRQEFLEPLSRVETPQNNIIPKMVDTEFIKEKRRLPFEKDDKKYKEFRL